MTPEGVDPVAAEQFSARPPASPRAFARWLWRLAREVVDEYRKDGVGDLAAAITFWTILSIPAAILALVSALSSLDGLIGSSLSADVEREVLELIDDTFVDADTLRGAVEDLFTNSSTGVATVATLVAVFTLSRAFAGLIRALDVAYDVPEGRPWWYLRIVAIGLGVASILVIASTATFLALLPSLPFSSLVRALAAPVAFGVLVLWAATIFHVGPNHRTPWRYDLPGAIVTALGWLLTSQGFALYVRLGGGGNEVQTGVAGVLLALTLVYLLSVVLLVGAQVNDVIARRSGVVQQVASITVRARSLRDRARLRRASPAARGRSSG